MNVDQYLLFMAITSVFLLSPGPSVMLSINNGVQYGIKRSSIAVCGNVVAFQLLIILSSLGLGAVLTASSEIFSIIKILGALYLIYLGVRIWISPITLKQKEISPGARNSSNLTLFRQVGLKAKAGKPNMRFKSFASITATG